MECRVADRNSVIVNCEYCGKEIRLPNFKAKKLLNGEQKHIYCSKECRYKNERPSIEELEKEFLNRGYILLTKKYHTAKTKLNYICIKHQNHGAQSITYDNFKSGYGCRYCGNESVGIKKRKKFSEVKQVFASKNLLLLDQEYVNSHIPLKYICNKHPEVGIQQMSYTNARLCNGCPHCGGSRGELKIINFLENHNIIYEYQKRFDDLIGVGNGKLSYDFFIPKLNMLIEYQGEYHDGTAGNQTNDQFIIQKKHDKRKKEYAESNGFLLEEIWYYENLQDRLNQIFH